MLYSSFNRSPDFSNLTFPAIIEGYVDVIKNRYSVSINIHDIAGFSRMSPEMGRVLAPYMYHNNTFCNYLKKQEKTFEKCLLNKDCLCSFCQKRKTPFYGRCYMGVEEYVYPVLLHDRLIVLICVGLFFSNLNRTLKRIAQQAEYFGLDLKACEDRFLSTSRQMNLPLRELFFDIGILGEAISQGFQSFLLEKGKPPRKEGFDQIQAESHKANHIVMNTESFIRENYEQNLTLPLLASNIYCNPSYLSHLFKEKMKMSIVDYINKVRIDGAKQLLDVTTTSITEIAYKVGYNDSGYFGRVFKQLTSLSPKEYRERESSKIQK